jgi:hypothetical protein
MSPCRHDLGRDSGGIRAQGHLEQIPNAMPAEVLPCKEILVPLLTSLKAARAGAA